MEKHITAKDVLAQLKADLIGKDSHRGVTLTYTWLANQFGHFSLGYIPTLIVYALLKRFTTVQSPEFWGAVIVAVLWLLFELYNFLGPLILKKRSKGSNLYLPSSKPYSFEPDWINIAFDTYTDVCFFWFGAFAASLFLAVDARVIIILAMLIGMLVYPCKFWFLTKMYLQKAKFPFQFRLSQLDFRLNDDDCKTVLTYLAKKDCGHHLLIFGGRRSGKTSLGVGIATERSIKRKACLYTTGMKLYNMFSLTDAEILISEKDLWTWRTSSLLVIDDINPGNPISANLVTSQQFLAMLDVSGKPNLENRNALKNNNVIWILGTDSNEKGLVQGWRQMLADIGVQTEKVYTIDLQFNLF